MPGSLGTDLFQSPTNHMRGMCPASSLVACFTFHTTPIHTLTLTTRAKSFKKEEKSHKNALKIGRYKVCSFLECCGANKTRPTKRDHLEQCLRGSGPAQTSSIGESCVRYSSFEPRKLFSRSRERSLCSCLLCVCCVSSFQSVVIDKIFLRAIVSSSLPPTRSHREVSSHRVPCSLSLCCLIDFRLLHKRLASSPAPALSPCTHPPTTPTFNQPHHLSSPKIVSLFVACGGRCEWNVCRTLQQQPTALILRANHIPQLRHRLQ